MADALVTLLNSYGYQPVFLARTGVAPPELYNFADHRLIRRGALANYFRSPVTFTPTSGRLGDLAGQVTSGKDLGAAVGFLTNALAVLGIGSLPKLDLSFTGSKELVFSFADVTYQAVDPADLDRLLQDLALPLAIPDAYVETGALHVAYEYAYARTLKLRRADGQRFAADVAGSVGSYVDVGAKAKVDVERNVEIAFTSLLGESAAFAYKAGRLTHAADRWTFEPEVVARTSGAGAVERRRPFLPAERVVLKAEID